MNNLITEYRDLLVADESISSLDSSLALLVRAAAGESGTTKKWLVLAPDSNVRALQAPISDVRRVKTITRVLSHLPMHIKQHVDDIPEDQYSFLMDTLLLVFHHALFGLLPSANGDRDAILMAMEKFSDSLPRQADKNQTRGLIEIERGQLASAADSFRASLAATHADDHDFITRVQMAWTVLMERRQFKNAFELLMDVYPRTSRADLMEVQDMLKETFFEVSSRARRSRIRA
jgi:hypothetical protein